MKVKINGDVRDLPEGLTVSALLEHLGDAGESRGCGAQPRHFAASEMG